MKLYQTVKEGSFSVYGLSKIVQLSSDTRFFHLWSFMFPIAVSYRRLHHDYNYNLSYSTWVVWRIRVTFSFTPKYFVIDIHPKPISNTINVRHNG